MPINENISDFIKRYKEEHKMSLAEMADEFGIAKSALESYLKGSGNPRADTLDLIAERSGVSAAEIISAFSPGWEKAEIMERAARIFSDLPPERREPAIQLFLALIDVLSEKDNT